MQYYERLILSTLLAQPPKKRIKTLDVLRENDFTSQINKRIYNWIRLNVDSDVEVFVTSQEFKNKEIVEILEETSLEEDKSIENTVKKLKQITLERELRELLKQSSKKVESKQYVEAIDILDSKLSEIVAGENIDSGSMRVLRDLFNSQKSSYNVLKTGLRTLDDKMDGGMHSGSLWVVGGRSGGGKSMWCTDFFARQVALGRHCLFFSTELSGEAEYKFLSRPIAKHLGITIEEAEKELGDMDNVRVYSKIRQIDSILAEVKKRNTFSKVDLFVIDHLQDLEYPEKLEDYKALSQAITKVKKFCNDNNIRAVVASQLNRASMAKGDIMNFGFLGSGKIEQVCDAAFVLARDYNKDTKEFDNLTQMYILKNRLNGRTGFIYLSGDGKYKSYEEFTEF